MAYEDRFVAFLDILGFKTIINDTEKNDAEYQRIKRVLNYIAEVRNDNYEGMFAKYGILKEISVFSNSIVISYSSSLSIGGALFHVLIDLVHICIDLLNANIYVRGGVTYGKMHYDKNICFGSAMVKAYMLEGEAVYPRIVIETEAIKMGLELLGQANTVEMEAEYLDSLICCDKAGIFYLDFLSQNGEFDESDYYYDFLNKVKVNLALHLSAKYSPRILKKYLWFAKYYNRTVKKVYKKYPKTMLIDWKKYG